MISSDPLGSMTNNFSKELPEDIMLLILPRLYLSDYFRCRAVSRSWLATIDRAIAGKRCPPSPQLPFLTFRSSGGEKDHCFLSPSEDLKVYKYSHPDYDMNKLDCVGSIEGWLIMVDHTCTSTVANFFLNPISGDKVRLPSQATIPCGGGDNKQASFLSKVIASSAPTNPNSCLVAAIFSEGRGLAFCRLADKSWTLIEADGDVVRKLEDVHDIEIVDGKLYAITTTGQRTRTYLHVFDIHFDDTNFNEDVPRHTYKAERLIWRWPDLKCSLEYFRHTELDGVRKVNYLTCSILKFYLFKDSASNELLMVSVLVSHPSSASKASLTFDVDDTNFVIPLNRWDIAEAFQVFKLEHNMSGPPRWVLVFELGDRILFLSKTTKLFIPITDNPYGLPHDKTRLEGNRIYFAFGRWKHDLGVFSLTDNTIQHYTIPKDHSPSRHTPPTWFTPNL